MGSFEKSFARTGIAEGGYSKVGTDKGGETYKGISRRWHPNWEGWALIDQHKARYNGTIPRYTIIKDAILDGMVERFYRVNIWDRIDGDLIKSQRITDFLYDWFVTSDDDAVKGLQLAADVKVDGSIGPKTIAAVNAMDEDQVMLKFKFYRREFYQHLVKMDKSQECNLAGWLKRVDSFA